LKINKVALATGTISIIAIAGVTGINQYTNASDEGVTSKNEGIQYVNDLQERIGGLDSSSNKKLYENEPVQSQYYDYIVHNGFYYVPISEEINLDKLDKKIGQVTRIGEWQIKEEGDTLQYIPGTKYYSIKDVSEAQKIAVGILEGTKKKLNVTKYQVFERKEPIEAIKQDKVYSAKGDEQEVGIAIQNIRKQIPFFREIKSSELKVQLINLENDGEQYLVKSIYAPKDVKGDNSKIIFMCQYQKGYKVTNDADFVHEDKILSSFTLNGMKWKEYAPKIWGEQLQQQPVFVGIEGDIIIEVKGQAIPHTNVKKYLEFLTQTSEVK